MTTAARPTPWRARLWLRLIGYPHPDRPFRSTSQIDLLRQMRLVARILTALVALLAAVIAAAIAGYAVPVWAISMIGAAGVWTFVLGQPHTRGVLASLFLTGHREDWTNDWEAAGCPFNHLWCMRRPPVDLDTFAAYHRALAPDTTTRLGAGTDPKVIWWLHARGVTLDDVTRYLAAGATGADIPLLAQHGLTPDDWERVAHIGAWVGYQTSEPVAARVIRLLSWLSDGRGALHPSDFATGTRPSLDTVLTVAAKWDEHRIPQTLLDPCSNRTRSRRETRREPTCDRCEGTDGTHDLPFARWTVNGVRVRDWVETTGILAPYFAAAGVPFEEAQAMVRTDPTAVTVASLQTLAALTRPPR